MNRERGRKAQRKRIAIGQTDVRCTGNNEGLFSSSSLSSFSQFEPKKPSIVVEKVFFGSTNLQKNKIFTWQRFFRFFFPLLLLLMVLMLCCQCCYRCCCCCCCFRWNKIQTVEGSETDRRQRKRAPQKNNRQTTDSSERLRRTKSRAREGLCVESR